MAPQRCELCFGSNKLPVRVRSLAGNSVSDRRVTLMPTDLALGARLGHVDRVPFRLPLYAGNGLTGPVKPRRTHISRDAAAFALHRQSLLLIKAGRPSTVSPPWTSKQQVNPSTPSERAPPPSVLTRSDPGRAHASTTVPPPDVGDDDGEFVDIELGLGQQQHAANDHWCFWRWCCSSWPSS